MCPALPHRNAASHRGISVFAGKGPPVRAVSAGRSPQRLLPRFSALQGHRHRTLTPKRQKQRARA
ncbi:hypothetical protein DESPIG_01907 [Desulfovibrio piger ATCC 29098]|uniref:Uncharacterized protein n=1 Tax=Desulfovibrio piger ATCC 29098 TaxID=411464 RepID=B6WUZ2_9BACT|nr:hypothetical protein DESPIG_01907 [Desulfovibrio piger ATCC 29098]